MLFSVTLNCQVNMIVMKWHVPGSYNRLLRCSLNVFVIVILFFGQVRSGQVSSSLWAILGSLKVGITAISCYPFAMMYCYP